MNEKRQRREGPGAIELIEEAVHLLRLAPGRALAVNCVGSLPFMLALLYFWADMSRSADAFDRCAPAALVVALLFLWLKTWQAIFVRELRAHVTGRPAQRLSVRRFLRVAAIQAAIQPSGLFLLPVALAILLPFGWACAFYQNATAFGAEDDVDLNTVRRKAFRQTKNWPMQNHLLLGILALFGLIVFLDVAIGLITVPWLLKTFLGIETAFTRGGWNFFNTTFLAAAGGIAWLCLDPLVKAVYALRCFYGESRQTGEDLTVELRRFAPSAKTAVAILLMLGALVPAYALQAAAGADNPPTTPAGAKLETRDRELSPPELDRAIEEVISRREYSWRLPREKRAEKEKGILAAFMDGLLETVRGWFDTVKRWVKKVALWIDGWLEKIFGKRKTGASGQGGGLGWMIPLQLLTFALLALVACGVAILCWRVWRRRRQETAIAGLPVAPVPDVADENVMASQLPEDEWLKLARELMGRGELRLALRALYLASLAHLAQSGMIHIAKFKSNRDYERELGRRARARPELQSAFARNVTLFDRIWYGMHEVTGDALEHFQANVERIRTC